MGILTRSGRSAATLPTRDLEKRVVWQCASLLLDYPDGDVGERIDEVRRMLAGLDARNDAVPRLRLLTDHLATTPVADLQADYVATFDQRRRSNLFLTYFAHGDTRKRGTALLRFKQTYLAAGMTLDESELPDHLCVVLEFAATVDPERGAQLLADHRAGLEMLRIALRDEESPWAAAVEVVCATLPPLGGGEEAAVQRLIAKGPPAEEVGLTAYGGPAFDALLSEKRRPVDLPMPVRARP